jgi:hypothetical protein
MAWARSLQEEAEVCWLHIQRFACAHTGVNPRAPAWSAQAEKAYRTVLEAYSSSPKLVRLYGKFREGIKSDPWGAAE